MKNCVTCEKELTGKQVKYCSNNCAQRYRRQYEREILSVNKMCPVCNKSVPELNKKYCSNTCSNKYHHNKEQKSLNRTYSFTCVICNISFSGTSTNFKYCSDECRQKAKQIYGKKYYSEKRGGCKLYNKICPICNQVFIGNRLNQKTCNLHRCRQTYYKNRAHTNYIARRGTLPNYGKGVCPQCGKIFQRKSGGHIYCTKKCNKRRHGNVKFPIIRKCKHCGVNFQAKRNTHIYCCMPCRYDATRDRQRKQDVVRRTYYHNVVVSSYPHLTTEKQFHRWFNNSIYFFGFSKLEKTSPDFPDVIAVTYDGKQVRIELEYNAKNFIQHKHDPDQCDLIISYYKEQGVKEIAGLPVLSLYEKIGEDLKPTKYFQEIFKKSQEMLESIVKVSIYS